MSTASNRAMRLDALLRDFVSADMLAMHCGDVEVAGVCLDSRLLVEGDLYLAIAGATTHGMRFAENAIAKGAIAVVTDTEGMQSHAEEVERLQQANTPVLQLDDLKQQAGAIAARFFSEPSKAVQVVAVTGTDGKTSVCQFIADALNGAGFPCGYIGTLGWGVSSLNATQLTTPDAVTLQKIMATMVEAGANVIALEASSHGLAEGRLDAVDINIAVLTNFGRDHLDYHNSLDDYKKAKARLFSWPGVQAIVVNGADDLGAALAKQFADNGSVKKVVFSSGALDSTGSLDAHVNTGFDVSLTAENVELHQNGIRFGLVDNAESYKQSTNLMGIFNVANLLACHGVLRALGHAANDASNCLSHVRPVAGRMEQFRRENRPTTIVDYAHTPQALSASIGAVRDHCDGALWVVFGCGGDRDAGKRAPMGKASEMADHIVVTDDNPRTESSAAILAQIVAGMGEPARATVIADRTAAIKHALHNAGPNDLVLVAGKGHEPYQIIGTEVIEYSDRNTVQRLLQEAV